MHRLTYFGALFLAIALALQSTAQTVCDAVCLGVTDSGSFASTVESQAGPECHSVQTNNTPSASLVPPDRECLHADATLGSRAERVLIGAERWARVSPSAVTSVIDLKPSPASLAERHTPPGNTVAAIAPLRL